MSVEKKVWHDEINIIRGLLIFIIFLYHMGFLRFFLPFFEGWIFFTIPTFLFISGLVLTMRYKDNLNVRLFYKRRFQYLLPAYFFWSIITIIVLNRGFNLQLLLNILTGWSPGIWFLFLLFIYYLLFPLLLKMCKKINRKLIFGIIFTLTCLVFILQFKFNIFFLQKEVIVFINENLEINITVFVHSIPFLIYFLMGILIGYNYEQFKEKIIQFRIPIVVNWFIIFLSIPFCFYFLDFLEVGHLNLFNLFYSISSIPFFFYIFTQIKSKFFNFNGNIAVGIFLTSPVVYTIVFLLFTVEERLFFIIPLIFFFFLNLKLYGSKFFYFNMKIAVGIFLVLPIVFTIFWNFVSFPFSSTFDYFIRSGFSFFMTYMICLLLIGVIRRIPYYQFILTEIVDRKIENRKSRKSV